MNAERRKRLNALLADLQSTGLRDAMDNLINIRDELEAIKDEEEEARDNLPDSLRDGEKGEAMYESITRMEDALSTIGELVDGFDFDQLDEAFSAIDDAKGQS
jgi:hypothetical protein